MPYIGNEGFILFGKTKALSIGAPVSDAMLTNCRVHRSCITIPVSIMTILDRDVVNSWSSGQNLSLSRSFVLKFGAYTFMVETFFEARISHTTIYFIPYNQSRLRWHDRNREISDMAIVTYFALLSETPQWYSQYLCLEPGLINNYSRIDKEDRLPTNRPHPQTVIA